MGLIPGGLLRERIVVLAKTRSSDGAGGWTDTFAADATVNGLQQPFTGPVEKIVAGELVDAELAQFWLDVRTVSVASDQQLQTADSARWEILQLQNAGSGLAFVVARRLS